MKKSILSVIFSITLTGNIFAGSFTEETTMRIENAVEILGKEGAIFQGRVIRITSNGSNAPTVRENALIRASWEVNKLGYEYFIILSEYGSASQQVHTTPGSTTTYTIGNYKYTIYTPPTTYTTNEHSVVMIILCISTDETGNIPTFSVSTRLPIAEQILEEERKQKAPGIYFDTGLVCGVGVSFDNINDDSNTASFYWRFVETRIGYGPFGKIPLYAVAESSISWVTGNIEYLPLFLGAGAIIYPARIFQLGFSLGVVWPLGFSIDYNKFDADPGFSWNVSAAYDFGYRNHGLLLGLQLSGTKNNFNYYELYSRPFGYGNGIRKASATLSSIYLTFLFKYAYRKKIPKQTVW